MLSMRFQFIELPQDIKTVQGRLLVLLHERDEKAFLEALQGREAPYYGAIFPDLIANGSATGGGALVAQLSDDCVALPVHNFIDKQAPDLSVLANKQTVFCFTDAFSTGLSAFVDHAFSHLGEGVRMLGGGAGKLTLEQEPVIFDNDGIYADSALLVGMSCTIGLGVGHGWNKVEGPFLVTGADGRVLQSLDYADAGSLYAELVEKHSGIDPRQGDFFQAAKSFPFGIISEDDELIVRDPVALDGDHLHLVGDISEYAVVHILHGDHESLLSAARAVARMARTELSDRSVDRTIIFDCISRSIFLGDAFQQELDAIALEMGTDLDMNGALTLGEIASKGDRFIRFHNKTCVVAAL